MVGEAPGDSWAKMPESGETLLGEFETEKERDKKEPLLKDPELFLRRSPVLRESGEGVIGEPDIMLGEDGPGEVMDTGLPGEEGEVSTFDNRLLTDADIFERCSTCYTFIQQIE